MIMCNFKNQFDFKKKCAIPLLLLMLVLSLPTFCISHSSENPSFKYSRSANENFDNSYGHNEPNEVHDHNGDGRAHLHAHDNHGIKTNIYQADITEIWLYSMGSTLFISAVPFLLLFIIPLDNSDDMRPRLKVLLAFASGGLLGDAFLHLIPHATMPHHSHDNHENIHDHSHRNSVSHGHDHRKDTTIGLWVLGGIIVFLTVEKFVRLLKGKDNFNHGHGHGTLKKTPPEIKKKNDESGKKSNKKIMKHCKTEAVEISGYLNLAADFTHNFTDGLAIGASFLAGNSIGIVTTITILLHEVPHEIGDFAILIKSGCSRRKAMLLQLVTALGALAGNVLALIGVGADADTSPWVLPFTAGGFIYIATVSVLPELLEESTKLCQSIKEICALLTGVFLMILIAYLE